jgi:hypothetical protein
MSVNTRELLVGKSTPEYGASRGAPTVADGATYPSDLAEGAIGIFDASDGTLIPNSDVANMNLATYPTIFIAQGTASTGFPVVSQHIQGGNLKVFLGKAYDSPVNAVAYLGYNGSTGSITVSNSTEYVARVIDNSKGYEPFPRASYSYKTPATGAGYTIANTIVGLINSDRQAAVYAEVVSNGDFTDFTGTATALKFTKGSKTVYFMIEDATAGWVASTGTVTAGDAIGVAHAGMTSVTFTADIAGTAAGRHVVTIGNTIYNVADAGTAAQNATAIAAAINAGTQATATVSTADVTIVLKDKSKGEKILVQQTDDDATWVTATLTVNATTGGTAQKLFKAAASVAAAASFELDREAEFDGYFLGGVTEALHTGTVASITAYGIKFTALVAGGHFTLAKDMGFADDLVTYTTAPKPGSGTYAQVLDLENKAKGYAGAQQRIWFPFAYPVYVEVGGIYDLITMNHSRVQADMTFMNDFVGSNINTQIALPSGSTQETKLLAMLNAWAQSSSSKFTTDITL